MKETGSRVLGEMGRQPDYTREYFLGLAHVTRFADYPRGFQESTQAHVVDCLLAADQLCTSYEFKYAHQETRLKRTLYIHDLVEYGIFKDVSAPATERDVQLAAEKGKYEREWARGHFSHVDYVLFDQFEEANSWFKKQGRLANSIGDAAILAAVIDKTTGNKRFHTNFVQVWNREGFELDQMPQGSVDYTFRQYDAWMSRLKDAGNRHIAGVCAQLMMEEIDFVAGQWRQSKKKPPENVEKHLRRLRP